MGLLLSDNTIREISSQGLTFDEFENQQATPAIGFTDYLTPIGLPDDPSSSLPPPGLESTASAEQPSFVVTAFQNAWDTVKNDAGSVVNYAETSAKNAIVSTYGNIKDAASTVIKDAVSPISSSLNTIYWYALGAIVVVGAIIYFGGKSGGLRVRV